MLKKILALALAGAMVIGSLTFAAGESVMRSTADTSISVTGLEEGDVAHFYQLIEWKGVTDTNKTEAANVGGWYAISPFDTVLTPAVLKAVLIGDTTTNPETPPTGITAELAGQLAKVTGATPVNKDAVSGTATYENAPAGMYMVLVTPKDVNTIYSPVFVSADYYENDSNTWEVRTSAASYSDEAAAKRSKLKIDKTASTTEDAWDDNKPESTTVGDTVSFTVETTIPGYGEVYTNPSFIMSDTLVNLQLLADTLTVTPATYQKEDDTGAVTSAPTFSSNATSSGYTITFDPEYLKTLSQPVAVTVTYDAKVTALAGDDSVKEQDNQVTITYSHDPSNESDFDVQKDTTQHYTFTIDASAIGFDKSQTGHRTKELVKVGLDAAGNPIKSETVSEILDDEVEHVPGPLADAIFGLYTDSTATTPYIPKNPDGTSTGTPFKVTSDAAGLLNIPDLDAGTYYLKEDKAPSGYIPDPHIYEIKIDATFRDEEITEYWVNGKWSKTGSSTDKKATYTTKVLEKVVITVDGGKASEHWFTNPKDSTEITWIEESAVEIPHSFKNVKGVELPSTGGIGTTIFYAGGAVLVLLAGVLLVSKRRIA